MGSDALRFHHPSTGNQLHRLRVQCSSGNISFRPLKVFRARSQFHENTEPNKVSQTHKVDRKSWGQITEWLMTDTKSDSQGINIRFKSDSM